MLLTLAAALPVPSTALRGEPGVPAWLRQCAPFNNPGLVSANLR